MESRVGAVRISQFKRAPMRTKSFFMAGAAGVVAITTAASRQAPSRRVPSTVTVAVEPRCPVGRDTQAVITPWNVTIAQGDDIEWAISEKGSATAISIVPKAPQGWPFATHQGNGTRQARARASGMRANARGRYSYNVEYVCRAGTPNADTVRIDPDVIIE